MTTAEMAGRICEWDAAPNPRYNLWTIGNSSEVVPGISSPFFSTVGRRFEYESGVAVVRWLGVEDLVLCEPPPAGNWAAVIGGRWALNLAFFNAFIGSWQTEGPSDLLAQYISSTDGKDISAQALDDKDRALRTWRRVRRIWGNLERSVARDRQHVEELRARERPRDFSTMSDKQLWQHSLRLGSTCARLLGRHLLVSGAAGDYTDRLNKFLDRSLPDEFKNPALVIVLTSALRDVESAAPAKGAWDVAKLVTKRKTFAEEVRSLSPNEIAERLRQPKGADWKAFAEAFAGFIARFGFRGMGEVDPSYADWEEEPAFALSSIKAYLDAPDEKNPHHMEEQSATNREGIEAQVLAVLPRSTRREYRELLAGAQKFTRLRESSKANWVRADRTLRRPIRELGRRFAERGLLEHGDDIFWLVVDEAEAGVNGTLNAAESKAAVPRRQAEAKRMEDLDLPEVFELPVTPIKKTTPGMDGNTLQGMPVSAGIASGPARVVLSTASALEVELEPGEVLVAPFTDAPWTPLFVPAAAVVVETGGILSHAATVAREFGIPAVVAVKGATQLIKTGQRVTVDGMTGIVTVGT
jgi:phosphohistidine swiveling domain-containing protein